MALKSIADVVAGSQGAGYPFEAPHVVEAPNCALVIERNLEEALEFALGRVEADPEAIRGHVMIHPVVWVYGDVRMAAWSAHNAFWGNDEVCPECGGKTILIDGAPARCETCGGTR